MEKKFFIIAMVVMIFSGCSPNVEFEKIKKVDGKSYYNGSELTGTSKVSTGEEVISYGYKNGVLNYMLIIKEGKILDEKFYDKNGSLELHKNYLSKEVINTWYRDGKVTKISKEAFKQ